MAETSGPPPPLTAADAAGFLGQLSDRLEALGHLAADPGFDPAAVAAGLRRVAARVARMGDESAPPDRVDMPARPMTMVLTRGLTGEWPRRPRYGPADRSTVEIGWDDGCRAGARLATFAQNAGPGPDGEVSVILGGRRLWVPMARSFSVVNQFLDADFTPLF